MLDSSEPSWRLATLSTFKWACHSSLTNRKIQLKELSRTWKEFIKTFFLFANSLESIFRVVRHAKAATRCPLSFTRCAYRNNNYSPFNRRFASEPCRRQKINNKKYDNRIYLYQFSRAICMSLTTRKPVNMDFLRNNSTYGGKKKRQLMLKVKVRCICERLRTASPSTAFQLKSIHFTCHRLACLFILTSYRILF